MADKMRTVMGLYPWQPSETLERAVQRGIWPVLMNLQMNKPTLQPVVWV